MKITYTGVNHELTPKVEAKLKTKFDKLSKILDGHGEKKAHVVVTQQRHLHKAEVTAHFFNHELVGTGSHADLAMALDAALAKVEKQALKHTAKYRDENRRAAPAVKSKALAEPQAAAPAPKGPAIRRVSLARRKPMSLEEAVLELEDVRNNYVAYLDAQKQTVSVLIRRADGNFDLIETS
jgi:putative sigma-54 modulation protein